MTKPNVPFAVQDRPAGISLATRLLLRIFELSVVSLFVAMLVTKPADANWRTWPTSFMIGLFQQSTAANARDYLGISIGTPDAPADAAEVQMDEDYIYFAVSDNQWVRVAVEAVYDMAELETGDLLLLESGYSLIFEEN